MEDLSIVDPKLGYAPCPYAKRAWIDDKVKIVMCEDDLWDRIADECANFPADKVVTVCMQEDPLQTYDELEAACMAMNSFFSATGQDLWLLSFQTDFAMVFVQKLSELDDASQKLEKMGYYANYESDDYVKLILNRRERRIRNEEKPRRCAAAEPLRSLFLLVCAKRWRNPCFSSQKDGYGYAQRRRGQENDAWR